MRFQSYYFLGGLPIIGLVATWGEGVVKGGMGQGLVGMLVDVLPTGNDVLVHCRPFIIPSILSLVVGLLSSVLGDKESGIRW